MSDATQPIRDLITAWMKASREGDVATLGKLMADDVVFLVPGQEPMRGREAFLKAFKSMIGKVHFSGTSTMQEVEIFGDLAYCWTHLTVKIIPMLPGTSPIQRSGYTLTILRRQAQGDWVISRDANLLGPPMPLGG